MDTRELRNVFGTFVTGVTVVTTVDPQGNDHGVTANSFSSVSLDPPLVLWSQALAARSFPAFRDADRFIVNILSERQRDLSQRFASSGADKFRDLPVDRRGGGVAALRDCCASIECRKVAMYPGGDHMVYLGEVLAVERHERPPLAFAGGRYMVAVEHGQDGAGLGADGPHLAHNDAVRLACAALPGLAARVGSAVGVAVWGNRGATLIRWEHAPRQDGPDLRTGIVMSPLTSATGLLFGACLPEDLTATVLQEALASHPQPAEAMAEHAMRLQAIRAQGHAASTTTTRRGFHGVSVPVFDAQGLMVLAFSAVGLPDGDAARTEEGRAELQRAARELSARLGHRQAQAQPAEA